jgi:hypothetical protein
MSPTIEDLLQSIDGRIRELNGEIASLQDALKALSSNGSSAPAPKPGARRARKQASKPTEVVPAGKLSQILADSDGISTPDLAKQANAESDQVLILLREMEVAGKVRRTGKRRGTRWHGITDEDRIQERAAELASRSKRRK